MSTAAAGVFWVPPQARWEHIQSKAKQPEIGVAIDKAMELIEADNPSLRGALPKTYARPALDKRRLGELIDLIGGIGLGHSLDQEKGPPWSRLRILPRPFRPPPRAGEAASTTHRPLSSASWSRCSSRSRGACTTRAAAPAACSFSPRSSPPHTAATSTSSRFTGRSSTDTTWRLARMNLAIRGIDADLGARAADTFHRDQHADLRADFVLANPPFNISDWGGELLRDDPRWAHGTPTGRQRQLRLAAAHSRAALTLRDSRRRACQRLDEQPERR